MFLVLLLYMLFASTFTLGKLALEVFDPIFFVASRMLLGGALLLGYQYLCNRTQWKFNLKDWALFAQLAFFHMFLAFALEFWALQYVIPSKACLIYNTSPFITALFAYFLLHERMNYQKWIGLLIGFIGMGPLLMSMSPGEDIMGSFLRLSWPELAVLGAVTSSVYGWMLFKRAMNVGYSPVMVNGLAMLGGGVCALGFSIATEGVPLLRVPLHGDTTTFGSLTPLVYYCGYTLLLILIANIVCYNLYGFLLRRYSTTFLSFAGVTCPLFAALFDWMLLGVTVGWHFFATSALTSLGLYIFYQKELSE